METPFWRWAGLPSSDLVFLCTHRLVWMPVISGKVRSRICFSDSSKKQIPFQFTASIKWFLGKLGPGNAEKTTQCYTSPSLLILYLSSTPRLKTLPENLVTSKNLEKSKGHWKRAKSTSCSFTVWRERRSCVYGACNRKRQIFLSKFWVTWSADNKEQQVHSTGSQQPFAITDVKSTWWNSNREQSPGDQATSS